MNNCLTSENDYVKIILESDEVKETCVKKLTKKQTEVLDYLKKYKAEHGYPPSVREIGKALGLSSPATVQAHLNRLKAAGVIKNSENKFRTIEILVENE